MKMTRQKNTISKKTKGMVESSLSQTFEKYVYALELKMRKTILIFSSLFMNYVSIKNCNV